ncbi:hypothetical protein RQP46_001359 [Phenoliferia psychrophenolica]
MSKAQHAADNAAILYGRQEVAELQNNGSELPWYKNHGMLRLNVAICAIFVAQCLNGYDGSLVSGFQALTPWKNAMGKPSASAIGLLNAAVYLSGLVTAPFARYVADNYGRRYCIWYTACTNLIGTVIGCAASAGSSNGYGMFLASRIICGSGIAFAVMVSPIMLQELPHPKQRTKLAGFFDCAFIIGNFLAAWVTFGCHTIKSNWSWRIPYIIHIPFALAMIVFVTFLPESPRWYMSKGRHEEARAFLLKYHANGATSDELVDFEMNEIQSQIDFELANKSDTWRALIATKGNRHRLACVCLIGICQNLSGTAIIAYYYTGILKLVGITATGAVTGINAGLTTFTFFVALFALWLTQRINRRPQLALSWCTTILANIGLGIAAVFFVWMYNGGFFIACGPLFFSYQAEILTYSTRAKGMMIWTVVVKCCSIFSAYTNSVALAKIGWHYYLVYTGILVVTGILMWLIIVETRGYTLEEVAVLFDGDDTAFSSTAEMHPDDKKRNARVTIKEVDTESA